MNMDILLDQISSSLSQLSVEARINNYNMLAGRLDKPQYVVSFPEQFDTNRVRGVSDAQSLASAGMKVEEQEQSIDQILLKAIELSSQNNRLITLMNQRIELERMIIRGGR
ncbi:TPA: hypothetical protein ACTGG1_001579 [Vibrio cholerae]|uniref:hypothetical protein n=1 Tax=Vibrio cholerae TaxID=666 RepID=UPI0004E38EF0|nr:hypothetical protein [Vibrio cholerae]EGQ8315810.1 hypothetical protein [Vibrio cholerae]EGQ9391514.1 hypothetical protein [Vibrio cholerae]EGR0538771.1 hypothetical protein [Vibrio cholerae]EGR2311429.1 hypothetical protein [Vibrio cholerae]EGR2847940.1 hypothetical protein [Vibrio cholerae]